MSEPRTPEDLLARIKENRLICEKLLGWHWCSPNSKGACNGFDWEENEDTPDFSSWGQAGLILDAMVANGCDWDIESTHTDEGARRRFACSFHSRTARQSGSANVLASLSMPSAPRLSHT